MVRRVERLETAVLRQEGDGLPVRRALPLERLDHVNPFVLVEEIGPREFAQGDTRTAPAHPMRGFEQITFVLDGSVTHARPDGNTVIAADQAEWLTTGAGDLCRSEIAAGQFRALRIWISLPRALRRVPRRVVRIVPVSDRILLPPPAPPVAPPAAGPRAVRIDLIAGRLLGARAPTLTLSQATVARVRIPAGATFVHAVDSVDLGIQTRTVVLYALSGDGFVGRAGAGNETRVTAQQLAIVTPPAVVGPPVPPWPNTDEVRIRAAPEAEFDLLWLSGLPVGSRDHEQILQRGPFALRTEEEILQAIEDYRTGRFGTLP